MKIVNAKFLSSAAGLRDSLSADLPEVAFLGRSNVGKSSLINALVDRKGLAKSSQTPGKTRLINFFSVVFADDEHQYEARFVDLPGVGYAKVSHSELAAWQKNLAHFLKNRQNLKLLVLLRDARHPDLKIDDESEEFAASLENPNLMIMTLFTKADKLNQKELSALQRSLPESLAVSVTSKRGIQLAREVIFEALFKESDEDAV